MSEEPTNISCRKCGAENPPEARFCGSCGNLLTPPPDPADSEEGSFGSAWPAAEDEGSRLDVMERLETEHGPRALDPDTPGAGLAPGAVIPPPPGQSPLPVSPDQMPAPPDEATPPGGSVGLRSQPQPPAQQYQQPPAGGYGQPPLSDAGQYQVPPPGYGYSMPADGNTTGMGEGYPAPEEAKGWNFGGFVPFGLYSFVNGNSLWGAIGLISYLLGLYWVYSIIVGFMGKEQAWRNRRFDSVQQYMDTMRVWNTWGLVLLLVTIGLFVLYFVSIFAALGFALTGSY